jgi:hypothetical protein
MTAQALAELIYRETGQVTSKGAVIGKPDRLRAEKTPPERLSRGRSGHRAAHAGRTRELPRMTSRAGFRLMAPESTRDVRLEA